jgi:signal transduction histidine kinase
MWLAGPACQTPGMSPAEIADRWRAGVAALQHVTGPPQRPTRWQWAADAALALVLTAGTLSSALNRDAVGGYIPVDQVPATPAGVPATPAAPAAILPYAGPVHLWQVVLAVLAALPLLVRRRYPLTAFWTVTGASLLYHLSPGFDATFTFAACLIAASSALSYSQYRISAAISALVGTGLLVGLHKEDVPAIRPGMVTFLLLIPVALTANAVHGWTQKIRAAEAEREAAAQAAVDRERARIAHELHDVVTHNVSMMVVQAGAARTVLARAPDKAHDALLAIEAGGRAAMNELRHVIDLLALRRDSSGPDATDDLTPPPGIAQLPALVSRVNDAGLTARLTVHGEAAPLPAGVDLAAYRVVQEALTNVVKHAAGARADVAVEYRSQSLHVEVVDTGGAPSPAARDGGGRGLIGLRERLAIYGGAVTAGPDPGGGYRVRADIPLEQR